MANYMGVDIGNATRNGIAILNDKEQLIYSTNIPYNKKITKGQHRRNVAKQVRELVQEYDVKALIIERVKMHRGGNLSKLTSIISLSKITAAILDNCFDLCSVYDCETISWKANVLGHRDATKEDAVTYVLCTYKKEVPHDEADAVCECLYLIRSINKTDRIIKDVTGM